MFAIQKGHFAIHLPYKTGGLPYDCRTKIKPCFLLLWKLAIENAFEVVKVIQYFQE